MGRPGLSQLPGTAPISRGGGKLPRSGGMLRAETECAHSELPPGGMLGRQQSPVVPFQSHPTLAGLGSVFLPLAPPTLSMDIV